MSSLTRRLPGAFARMRSLKMRAEGHKGGYFSEGTHEPGGNLFGETPLAPGQSRKWESWEAPW
jgi:hypothetical protein